MKVLLFDNPNGYAFLFLSKINIKNCEIYVLAEKDNIYNLNWPDIDKSNVKFYKSSNFIKGIKLLDNTYLKKNYFKQFDKIISFTYTGLLFLAFRNLKPLYYNIGGFKDFYCGYKNVPLGLKYFYKYSKSIIFKLVVLNTKLIIVSNQMDFDHVFNSFFSYKIKFLPIFVPKWKKYKPSFSNEINFVHFSAQSHRLKNNPVIFTSLSEQKKRGINFKLHIFLWGIDKNKSLKIINDCDFKDDIIIKDRLPMNNLIKYVNKLPRVFILGEFSDYTGPGSGGAIRECSSAGIPSISYVKNDDFSVEPTSMYLNSKASNLSQNLFIYSSYSKTQYINLCSDVFNEFNQYYSDSTTNLIFKNILNEIY